MRLRDYSGIIELWAAAIRKLALVFVPVYTLLFVVRHEFITLLFTKTYAGAAPIFAINSLGILLYICVPTSILRSFDNLKYFRLRLSLLMIPIACLALYAGIRVAGMTGAITAFVIVQTVDLSILLRAISRKLKMSPRDIRRFAPLARTAAATVVAALMTALIKFVLARSPAFVVLAICSSVFMATFAIMAFITGAVTASEKAEMRGTLLKFHRLGAARLGFSTAAEIQEQRVG